MKSIYAVAIQLIISASNFIIYLIYTNKLDSTSFIAFSTAVGLTILSYAIAEGGISYVAPKTLTGNNNYTDNNKIAATFIFICLLLFSLTLFLGFISWNLFSRDKLNILWVLSYSFYFLPVIIMPSWLTFRSILLSHSIIIGSTRVMGLFYIFLSPTILSLNIVSIVNIFTSLICLYSMNKKNKFISLPRIKELKYTISIVREVFLSKTSSYAIYSSIPFVIAVCYGNNASALYILGERLKSMYSTLFQPVIQSLYLWCFQKKSNLLLKKKIIFLLSLINVLLFTSLIALFTTNIPYILIERLQDIPSINSFIVAATLSVFTAIILYFHVFPSGLYKLFRISTYFQLSTFLILFIFMKFTDRIPPGYILAIGEGIILLSVIALTIKHYNGEK
ncbi:TPA: hypothetical protein RG728_002940 [Morganella morganii subsp. morganii]|uniref:hypothetical protein n=2 Tax=Morganella morganii TaxID=582 RepID=UPI000291660F|nr:hypothetical protein [Morganella morganii]HDS6887461.1 hypothetical protein [Morganella morganii subsp. morganii]EKW8487236.1 hypothetical protein [Morganella morganii]ELO7538577.1 hypothetical protein [Morganella morganii]EMP51750.1 hypothetical protein C790_00937 [Morganella morganii SC01]MBN4018929.1 hypothetical protein [Morganella morganii]